MSGGLILAWRSNGVVLRHLRTRVYRTCSSNSHFYGVQYSQLCKHHLLESNPRTPPMHFLSCVQKSQFHMSALLHEDVKSQAERGKEIISDCKKLADAMDPNKSDGSESPVPVKKSIKAKIIAELKHYYHGFRLLFIDVKICSQYVWNVLNGHTLTRRERRQLVRTTADLFRLIPFSVFIIVPFMEFTLPIFLKLFPGMLPSTFAEANKEMEKRKKRLKAKLEIAKFLQDTVEESALEKSGKGEHVHLAKEFSQFLKKVREEGTTTSVDDLLKFTKLFKDDITLDNMTRPHLVALCKLLEVPTIGTSHMLAFQLRTQLRKLKADDKMIMKEGIGSLTESELQSACRARGMRSLGVPEWRLRYQLKQWLDMHLNDKIPISLLLMSRALYLPEHLSKEEQLMTIISRLPESTTVEAELHAAEATGEKIDPKVKLELIKMEEEAIKREKAEDNAALAEKVSEKAAGPVVKATDAAAAVKEKLVDKAQVLTDKATVLDGCKEDMLSKDKKVTAGEEELSIRDIEILEDVLEKIAEEKKIELQKNELKALKEDVQEYNEDLSELRTLVSKDDQKIKESKAAKRLSSAVDRMIANLTMITEDLHRQKQVLLEDIEVKQVKMKRSEALQHNPEARTSIEQEIMKEKDDVISINELVLAMKRLQKVPDDTRLQKIAEILDEDKDGNIEISHVLRVLQELGTENVQIKASKMTEIIELLKKEEDIETEAKLSEKLLKKVSNESNP